MQLNQNDVAHMCSRNTGVGADGLLAFNDSKVFVYNADGTPGGVCLNGLRCVADLLFLHKNSLAKLTLEMGNQKYECRKIESEIVTHAPHATGCKQMSIEIDGNTTQAMFVEVGNPHFIIDGTLDPSDFYHLAQHICTHPQFNQGTNVEQVQQLNSNTFKMLAYERGVGPTQACSSGAVAVLTALYKNASISLNTEVTIRMPGGSITGRYTPKGIQIKAQAVHVYTATLQKPLNSTL